MYLRVVAVLESARRELADAKRYGPIVSPFTRAVRLLSYFKKV